MAQKICTARKCGRTRLIPLTAQLHISIGNRNGSSYLKEAYCTTPFKVANITGDRTAIDLQLMIMSASPGMLDGDVYDMKIHIGKNCALRLHTQAYQRLFTMKYGALQQLNVQLEDGASFVYLPHPCVPHEQSVFTSRNDFFLNNHCHFVFGEILTCGRKLNGEAFLFSKYHSISKVFINNELVIKENLLLQPSLTDVQAIGQLEGYSHQASLIFLNDQSDIKKLKPLLLDLLSVHKNITYGISEAPVNGLIVRLLGNGAELLFKILKNIEETIHQTINTPVLQTGNKEAAAKQ